MLGDTRPWRNRGDGMICAPRKAGKRLIQSKMQRRGKQNQLKFRKWDGKDHPPSTIKTVRNESA